MKKKRNLLFDILGVFLISVFSLGFVSCKYEDVEEDRLVDVSFAADDGSSRAVSLEMTEFFNPEICWWIYTAEKISGIHTTGESEKDGSGNLKWRAVRDNECGLSGFTNQFSEGKWRFIVEGYHTQTASKNRTPAELIFTGEKEVVLTKDASKPNKPVPIIFNLTDRIMSGAYTGNYTGIMIRDFSIRVPEGVAWKTGDKVEIKTCYLDNFGGTNLIDSGAEITHILSKNYSVGEVLTLSCQIPKTVSAGQHYLGFCVNHHVKNGSGFLAIDNLKHFFMISVPVYVRTGCITFVSGEYELDPMHLMGGRVFYIDGTTVTGQTNGKMIIDGKAYWFGTATGTTTSYNISGIAKGAVTNTYFKNNFRSYVCFGADVGKDQMYVVDDSWSIAFSGGRGFSSPTWGQGIYNVGTGKSNWANYKANPSGRCGYFASQSAEHNGFTDWYMGSLYEMQGLANSGGFTVTAWTSSSTTSGSPYAINMSAVTWGSYAPSTPSVGTGFVYIPIRSF